MLDYKDIIIKHYALHMSGRQIAAAIGASKSGVNDFLKAFEQCESLSYPLPAGITNYGIAELVYGRNPEGVNGLFFVKYFSLKKASEFPFFSKGFSLPSAGIMHPCA